MKEIVSIQLDAALKDLFSYAIADEKIEQEYNAYIFPSENRKLYGIDKDNMLVGFIGIELSSSASCEIKHIAVSPSYRKRRTASNMIDFVRQKHAFTMLSAETDKDAVGFYRRCGFEITSLGEKYSGIERFLCVLKVK